MSLTSISSPDTRRTMKPVLLLFWAILIMGTIVRLVGFPNLPEGLNQDELSAAYEAWSLQLTGAQSWGDVLPVYFSQQGTGQNVLYAYLNVPFVALFGPTTFGIRLLGLLLGIGTLPLLYLTMRRWYGRGPALLGMALTALLPWHYMLTHWALESNILPAVFLLGVYLVTCALQTRRRWLIPVSLIPFALACYAYGIACVPVAVLLILLPIFYHRTMRRNPGLWVTAYAVAAIIVLPFALFIGKFYGGLHYPFESDLFFSLPNLTGNRLNDLQSGNFPNIVRSIMFVIGYSSNDYSPWNGLPVGNPVPVIFPLLALGYLLGRFINQRHDAHALIRIKPTLPTLWIVATLSVWFVIPINVNENNGFYLPMIMLASVAIYRICMAVRTRHLRQLTGALITFGLLTQLIPPLVGYFGPDYRDYTAANFNPGLQQALTYAKKEADGKQVYVSNTIWLNYLQTLWYLKVPPQTFRAAHPSYANPDFENFVFNVNRLNKTGSYLTVQRQGEVPLCPKPLHQQTVAKRWVVTICPPSNP